MQPSADSEAFDDFFQQEDEQDDESRAPFVAAPRMVPPRLGMLAQLDDDEFDMVARAARLNHVDSGTVVVRQGDEADRFFMLIDGAVEVSRDGAPLATLGPGAFFGESALLVRGRRSATVTALADSSIWSVSYEAFDQAMSRHLLADDEARREAERRITETPVGGFDAPSDDPAP